MRIFIWAGNFLTHFDPSAINQGIGGSETALVSIAEQLGKLSHTVCVGGSTLTTNHHLPGVLFSSDSRICRHPMDVFISWRSKNAIRLNPELEAVPLKIFWAQDVSYGPDDDEDFLLYDKIFVLSNFAKKRFLTLYPHVPESRLFITRNGIDPSFFHPREKFCALAHEHRIPNFVWASSPNRGLETMLNIWPEIRKMIPSARLSVCYGFNPWKSFAQGDPKTLEEIECLTQRVLHTQGVDPLGMVSKIQLSDLLSHSAFWIYPTSFEETSCIAAMEAQAAGCWPITTSVGALPETVEFGTLVPGGSDVESSILQSFENCITLKFDYLLTAWGNQKKFIETHSWESISKEWNSFLKKNLSF